MTDDAAASAIEWNSAWAALRHDGVAAPPSNVNIADLAVDRHVRNGFGDRVALRWIGRERDDVDDPVDLTYARLADRSARFAAAMRRHGFGPGTAVASLAGRVPDFYVAVLGALKAQATFTPLSTSFGPEPIAQRLNLGGIKVLVTTPLLFRRSVAGLLDRLPHLELVLVCGSIEDRVGVGRTGAERPRVMSYGSFLTDGFDRREVEPTSPDTPALLHFTSGTTGPPKCVVLTHEAVVVAHRTGRLVLDLHDGDTFWCTADQGWVTGTIYGIIAPLTNGVTSIIDEADMDAERWWHLLEQQQVDVLYTTPTALRMLQRASTAGAPARVLPHLRLVASVGEPLAAETVEWARATFAAPVLDTWWQTETGGIMIANRRSQPVRPGSMGRPIPGIEAALLAHNADADGRVTRANNGAPVYVTEPDQIGEIVLKAPWPSMFQGYLDQDERYRQVVVDGWYRTGDLARRDSDGYYWFCGRGDDMIATSGHLVGPFEVESALNRHSAVAESGVVGRPDDRTGAIVTAFVVLARGHEPSDTLRRELLSHASRALGDAVAPRAIEFVDELPHTRRGEIRRSALAAAEPLSVDPSDHRAPDDDL